MVLNDMVVSCHSHGLRVSVGINTREREREREAWGSRLDSIGNEVNKITTGRTLSQILPLFYV